MKKTLRIKNIKGREILDSRGEPTVEVELETDFGIFSASVPSGASKGKYEALELRDGGKRYLGKGVLKAVRNVNEIISPKLQGKEFSEPREIDEILIELDGTENKSYLGANAILAVSLAVWRASAFRENLSLFEYIAKVFSEVAGKEDFSNFPKPCFNIINGGLHAGNDLQIQEFMIVPQFEKIFDNLRAGCEIYHTLKKIIQENYGKKGINVGDEGGFTPPISKSKQALDLIEEAIGQAGYSDKVKLGLDCAANEYLLDPEPRAVYEIEGKRRSSEELLEYYQELVEKYPIIFIEDPFAEDDFQAWQKINSKFKAQNSKFLIVGDDLLATNIERMKIAKEKNLCNAMILKINQIGTVSETLEAGKLAKDFGWKIIVSHRSGETCDKFISDFAVGISADFIKAGAPARGERVAKYNRLLEIGEVKNETQANC